MTAYVIRHEQCPECARLGRDRTKDNLAIYSDGHVHCFSCGYHTFPDAIAQYKNKKAPALVSQHKVFLPEDIEFSYPDNALKWMEQYGFNRNSLIKHNIGWSPSTSLLVFPYYFDGILFAWQGRYFGNNPKHPKWLTYGKIHDYSYVLSPKTSKSIIIVEDIVSALKLSKYQSTLPLFGSHISPKKFQEISYFYDTIIIWLDPDKKKEALQFQKIGLQYCANVFVVFSDKDPKELKEQELEDILASKSIIRSDQTST